MGRVIGLDVGSKRIGVAVSDELRILATPHGMIRRQTYNKDAAAIAELVEQFAAETVVVGLPLGLSGKVTAQTTRVQQFAAMLASRLPVPVEQWDERLTTAEARTIVPPTPEARRAGRVDAVAAALILQGFLDEGPGSPSSSSPSRSSPSSASSSSD
jgi:putative Holliday junction resolvase